MASKKQTSENSGRCFRVEDAVNPLRVWITKNHCDKAHRSDGRQCVIAQALREVIPALNDVEVGSNITKVNVNGKIIRYSTPPRLRAGLREFDQTGEWKLPEGMYLLLPPKGRDKLARNQDLKTRDRWKKWSREYEKRRADGDTKSRGGVNGFKARPLLTRKISIQRSATSIPLNN